VVTHRHTDKQTNAGENIFPRLCGVNKVTEARTPPPGAQLKDMETKTDT